MIKYIVELITGGGILKRILFVCTGNTCRSPMAEGIFKKMLSDKGTRDVECSSAGLFAMSGDAACENAVKAAQCFGADISSHRARRITSYILDETDEFVCMTSQQAASLSLYVSPEKVKVLGDGVPDPFGGDLETYMSCANAIRTALEKQFDELVGDENEA